jgi:hypothetical protein
MKHIETISGQNVDSFLNIEASDKYGNDGYS